MLNNPLMYTDPTGELLFGLLFFTDVGYEIQKYISPIAFKVDLNFGTHQNGIGFDVSVGVPKSFPYAYRENWGATYFTKSYGDYQGWETRKGWEESFLGVWHEGQTVYTSGEFSQTTGFISAGIPKLAGFTSSNDLWGDKGDRYRTAHAEINALGFSIGLSLFTAYSSKTVHPFPDQSEQFLI